MSEQANIVAAARGLVGTPYRHQGRDTQSGLDCLGVVIAVAQAIGWPTELDRQDYERFPDGSELRFKLLASGVIEIAVAEAGPGDIVQIRLRGTDGPGQHCGIVVDGANELHLIHAYERRAKGRVVEEPLRRWQRGLLGEIAAAYRFSVR